MQRAACLIRIGDGQIRGVWHGASWSGGQSAETVAAFNTSGNSPTLGDAMDSVLAAIAPERRLTSPFVCVTLEGSHVMAAILSFPKLPSAQRDRRLVVSQRFCREHRLDPAKVEVIAAPINKSTNERRRILCLAMERDTLNQIRSALEKRGLHADVITPDSFLKFEHVSSHALEKPGIALFEEHGFRTILVWDEEGAIAHIATVRRPSRHDLEGQRRMATRIRRYARIITQDAPVAVYIDGLGREASAPDLAYSSGLKILNWPGASSDFRRAAE
ncbi:MAG: hypothetical protein WB610_01285 [Rhodomicrobium sp.]|jgi:hypothetical protein